MPILICKLWLLMSQAVSKSKHVTKNFCEAADTKVHSVKMQAEFEAPMWHVMALMVEFDLTSTWNTHMQVQCLSREGKILLLDQ